MRNYTGTDNPPKCETLFADTDHPEQASVWHDVDGYWYVAVRGTKNQPRFRTEAAAKAHALKELRRVDREYERQLPK